MSATCCSKLQTQVHRSEADLARIARLASWTGTPTARQLSLIAEAKAMLADHRAQRDAHEAECVWPRLLA